MPDLTQCKWHHCHQAPGDKRRSFIPNRKDQEFCSAECRRARATWRQTRGSTLVDLVIEGRWKELRDIRKELIKETS